MNQLLKESLLSLLHAITRADKFFGNGMSLLDEAFKKWYEATQNPIHKLIIILLNFLFGIACFLIGWFGIMAVAASPVWVFLLFKWLTQ